MNPLDWRNVRLLGSLSGLFSLPVQRSEGLVDSPFDSRAPRCPVKRLPPQSRAFDRRSSTFAVRGLGVGRIGSRERGRRPQHFDRETPWRTSRCPRAFTPGWWASPLGLWLLGRTWGGRLE